MEIASAYLLIGVAVLHMALVEDDISVQDGLMIVIFWPIVYYLTVFDND